MCGIAAFIGEAADLELLELAAIEGAAPRGPHSWGWAWWLGEWSRIVGDGPLPGPPDSCAPARVILGHSRLATSGAAAGDAPPPEAGQPIVVDGIALAHNGTVRDVPLAAEHLNLPEPETSDSVLLAVAASRATGPLTSRLGSAVTFLAGGGHEHGFAPPGPAVIVLSDGRGIAVARVGENGDRPHPLYRLARPEGVYLTSRPFHDECELVGEGVTRVD